MSTFVPKPNDYSMVEISGKKKRLLAQTVYDAFDASLLGLGDITKASVTTDAVAAVFDLQGFTHFCKQIEPRHSVPSFLSAFLNWLLERLKAEMTQEKHGAGVKLWCPLPFFVKFLGDGLLVLWDASQTNVIGRRNIIGSAWEICRAYGRDFLPTIQKKVVDPPRILRCGVARGDVYSVGDGNDFVGSCINMAARLEKLGGTTFAFNVRGFDLENEAPAEFFRKNIVVKKIAIRGIGDGELVAILKSEYEAMKAVDKKPFKDP